MALITDADIVEIPELLLYENSLLEIAEKERVEIAAKVRLAIEEVRTKIGATLRRTGSDGLGFQRYSIRNVVVTDALRWWLHCHALHLFYLECYGHQLNERFKRKEEEYARRSAKAQEAYLESGVSVSARPLPRPASVVVDEVAGALSQGHYYVAAAWQGSNGEESGLSPMLTFASDGAGTMRVSPQGSATHAVGWNVYVGTTADNVVRQNTNPIAIAQPWVMGATWNGTGEPWVGGQTAEIYIQPDRISPRG